jgi:phage regulator Rha-like protein
MSKQLSTPSNRAQLKLIEVHGQYLNTTSEIIAASCGVQHKNVLALIKRHLLDITDVGRVAFETRTFSTSGGSQEREIALLDDYAAMLLLTHMRSSEIVAAFKKALIQEFKRMRKILSEPRRKEELAIKRNLGAEMSDMLKFVRETDGKDTASHHYSNEHLFCNRALTGVWGPIDESELDVYDTKLLAAIRKHNSLLMSRYPSQKDRKKPMEDFVSSYRAKYPRTQLH